MPVESAADELSSSDTRQISPALVRTLAAACAISVANLYYNQPLLVPMAKSFHATQAQIGIVPALSQIGYAAGLFFLVPLGDVVEGRRLILLTLGGVTIALFATAFAPSLGLLAFFSFATGVTTVVPQMLIPFGVRLSSPQERGKTVGSILAGLLLGILLSRTAAGFIGDHLGWRSMYKIAGCAMIVLAVVLRFLLPESPPAQRLRYVDLLRSVAQLAREQALLREAALSGGLIFGTFSAFWATIAFLLAGPTYRLGPSAAGLFGLVGAVGALAAPIAGRLADKRSPRTLIGGAAVIVLLSYIIFGLWGRTALWALVLGVILLDLGVQSGQVTNLARVYKILPDAGSRLNTVYMTTYFLGGALGSYLAVRGWAASGWLGVCIIGAAFSAAALTVNSFFAARRRTKS